VEWETVRVREFRVYIHMLMWTSRLRSAYVRIRKAYNGNFRPTLGNLSYDGLEVEDPDIDTGILKLLL